MKIIATATIDELAATYHAALLDARGVARTRTLAEADVRRTIWGAIRYARLFSHTPGRSITLTDGRALGVNTLIAGSVGASYGYAAQTDAVAALALIETADDAGHGTARVWVGVGRVGAGSATDACALKLLNLHGRGPVWSCAIGRHVKAALALDDLGPLSSVLVSFNIPLPTKEA